jgi:hypothetical protein
MNSDSYPFPKFWATSGSDISLDVSSASPESRIPYAEISTLKPERLYFLLTGHHPLSPALPSKPPPDAIPIALGSHLSSRVPKRMRLDPVTTAKGRSTGTIWDEEAEMCFLLCKHDGDDMGRLTENLRPGSGTIDRASQSHLLRQTLRSQRDHRVDRFFGDWKPFHPQANF